jgi:hypothetical protein
MFSSVLVSGQGSRHENGSKDFVSNDVFTVRQGSKHENTQWNIWLDPKGFGMGMLKQGKIHYFKPLFGDFHRRKDPRSQNLIFFLLDILLSHQDNHFFLRIYFLEVLILEDNQCC